MVGAPPEAQSDEIIVRSAEVAYGRSWGRRTTGSVPTDEIKRAREANLRFSQSRVLRRFEVGAVFSPYGHAEPPDDGIWDESDPMFYEILDDIDEL